MKKFCIAVMACIAIMFTACDDKDPNYNQTDIAGTWSLYSIRMSGVGVVVTSYVDLKMTFTTSSAWSVSISQMVNGEPQTPMAFDGSYTIGGEKLVLSAAATSVPFHIATLNNSELNLSFAEIANLIPWSDNDPNAPTPEAVLSMVLDDPSILGIDENTTWAGFKAFIGNSSVILKK